MHTFRVPLFACLIVLVCGGSRASAQVADGALWSDGARWIFVGDEVTQRGSYLLWVTAYLVTRYPDRAIDVVNAGVAGDRVETALKRHSWDVAARQPTEVFLWFGGHDLGLVSPAGELLSSTPGDATVNLGQARAALSTWIGQVRSANATAWVVAPGSLFSVARPAIMNGTRAAALGGYDDMVREVAIGSDGLVKLVEASGSTPPPQAMAESVAEPGAAAESYVGGPAAHLALAWAVLKAVGAPAEVASLSIDLRAGQFVANAGIVEKVVRSESTVSFTWTARALPLPLTPDILPVLNTVPIIQDLNRESLQVAGLRPGRWELVIDGTPVREFTSGDLEAGINLATETGTPQSRQARDVLRLLETRERLVADNLRSVAAVEHWLLPDGSRPVSADQIRELLAARLAATHVPAFEREALARYEQRKAREAASAGAAARLLTQARRAAQPQSHLYLLRFVR